MSLSVLLIMLLTAGLPTTTALAPLGVNPAVAAPIRTEADRAAVAPRAGEAAVLAGREPVHSSGYITMRDGVRLKYALDLPSKVGTFPVALAYDPYAESAGALQGNDAALAQALFDRGFAVLGVNIRGTGCSEGQFDMRSATEALDGAEVVAWAARQSWSTGRVGMFGSSYPGLSQPRVAALRPPGLAAIAPFQIVDDVYTDVGYPGGILNVEFATFWSMLDQPSTALTADAAGAAGGDTGCVTASAQSAAPNIGTNVFIAGAQHPFRESFWTSKKIGDEAERISVPTFGCLTWQDDEVGSYPAASFFTHLRPQRTWVVAANGYHVMCDHGSDDTLRQTVRFFDRFVAENRNGFERTPHVQLLHETYKDAAGVVNPRWVTTYPAWPPAVETTTMWLTADSKLTRRPARDLGATSYRYPTASAGTENGIVLGQRGLLWAQPFDETGAARFTTSKLAKPLEVFGPASLDVWLSSTATDTDLQATITEVRPDGMEIYVARGWLRASHRALDRRHSSPLLPAHRHTQDAARPLQPGEPTKLRLAVFPFNHVFRNGSRLRVIIDTPSQTGGWNFAFHDEPATNTIWTGPRHPSALRLGLLPTPTSVPGYPICGSMLNQPCRPDPFGADRPR